MDIDHSIQQAKENAAKMTNLDKSANFLKNDGQCYQYSKLYNVKIFLSKIQTLYISSSNFEKDKLMTVMISFHKIKIQIEFIEVQIIFQSIWIESIFSIAQSEVIDRDWSKDSIAEWYRPRRNCPDF